MNPYIFEFDNFGIRWYSVLILAGAFIAILLVLREGNRFDISRDFLFNVSFWAIVFGIIGARIYYVLFNFESYKGNLLSILKIWEGGLAIHGGIIAGLITILLYCRKYKVSTLRIIDLACPALIIAQAIGRWGNFFNSEAHGAATTLATLQKLHLPNFIIEGMHISGTYYHPTFLYESIACLIGFIILIVIRRFKYIKVGTPTGFYLIYYGVVRFLIESMRTDSLYLGGLKMAQLISIAMFIVGIIILITSNAKKGKFENLYNDQYGQDIKF